MNQPHILVKVGVVASALLLVGGLVLYRAGVLDRFVDSSVVTQAAFVSGAEILPPDSPGTRTPVDSARLYDDSVRRARRFFYGSKSSPDMIPYPLYDSTTEDSSSTSTGMEPDTVDRRERHMGGSKSLAPIFELETSDTQKPESPRNFGP